MVLLYKILLQTNKNLTVNLNNRIQIVELNHKRPILIIMAIMVIIAITIIMAIIIILRLIKLL